MDTSEGVRGRDDVEPVSKNENLFKPIDGDSDITPLSEVVDDDMPRERLPPLR